MKECCKGKQFVMTENNNQSSWNVNFFQQQNILEIPETF